jgi:hypothetical protein
MSHTWRWITGVVAVLGLLGILSLALASCGGGKPKRGAPPPAALS